ncbi:hypothetical protein CDAR_192691 [Caerostris darwini]|uniref:Uncharacterized protein n=1 Tax=Caerostris darwini TaxID=1538125 RepID=A0AAV4NQC6_9ARAC|nr:hypothetical protein CDAR_192691 [Caerostris darwini]
MAWSLGMVLNSIRLFLLLFYEYRQSSTRSSPKWFLRSCTNPSFPIFADDVIRASVHSSDQPHPASVLSFVIQHSKDSNRFDKALLVSQHIPGLPDRILMAIPENEVLRGKYYP